MAKSRKFPAEDLPPDYEVGFGKPPKETQFKKGQSGNPKGRPKGSINLMTRFDRALRQTVTVVEHGKKRQVIKADALVMQLVNQAVQGQIPHLRLLLPILQSIERMAEAQGGKSVHDLTDPALLASLLERLDRGTNLVLSAPSESPRSADQNTASDSNVAAPANPDNPESDT